jgi:DNA-binding MarR family transcriptional regulator
METTLIETTFLSDEPTRAATERKEARRIFRRTDLQHWLAAMVTDRDMLLVKYVLAHPELSMKQIALRFGLTQPEVSRIANRLGVTRKRGRRKKRNY